MFKETSFHLVFKDENNLLPLIALHDLFVEYDHENGYYTLYILMEKAESDLREMRRELTEDEMPFKTFFPIMRYTILGLAYMHSKGLAHRDIKSLNILIMKSGKCALADYGEGINLAGEERYDENDHNYMIGRYGVRGTVTCLSPQLWA